MSKIFSWLSLLMVAIAFVGCTKDPIREETPDQDEPSKNKMLNLVNEYRKSGCKCGSVDMPPVPALQWNAALEAAATAHSLDMNQNSFLSHAGSDGSNAADRITAQGYAWKTWGENIAQGYTSEEAAMAGWISSPDHCKNIMDAGYKEMGSARRGTYWTQVFAAR